jgi:hypothetical protein
LKSGTFSALISVEKCLKIMKKGLILECRIVIGQSEKMGGAIINSSNYMSYGFYVTKLPQIDKMRVSFQGCSR